MISRPDFLRRDRIFAATAIAISLGLLLSLSTSHASDPAPRTNHVVLAPVTPPQKPWRDLSHPKGAWVPYNSPDVSAAAPAVSPVSTPPPRR